MKLRVTISKYHSWYFLPNITTNHAITYTNHFFNFSYSLAYQLAIYSYNILLNHFFKLQCSILSLNNVLFCMCEVNWNWKNFFLGFTQAWKVPEFLTNPRKVLEFLQESIPENHHILKKKTSEISEFPIWLWLEFQMFRVV